MSKDKFEVIRVSGIATGVGFVERKEHGFYSEKICETLFDTGDDEKDAAESEKWATIIAFALNHKSLKTNTTEK